MCRIMMLVAMTACCIVSHAQERTMNAPASYDNVHKEQLIKQQMQPVMSYDLFVAVKDGEVKTLKKMPVVNPGEKPVRFNSVTSVYQHPQQDFTTRITFKPRKIIN